MAKLTEAGERFSACVCDPPYGLEFMGKKWDAPWETEWQSGGGAGFSKMGIKGMDTRAMPAYGRRDQMPAFQSWCVTWARGIYNCLQPGAYFLAFGGTRTYHRLASAIEEAGFEIRCKGKAFPSPTT
jgi:hypothetical protein